MNDLVIDTLKTAVEKSEKIVQENSTSEHQKEAYKDYFITLRREIAKIQWDKNLRS